MEAELVNTLPEGDGWQYEPKWDGFRGILENLEGELQLWSRNARPRLRYFPELRALGDELRDRFGPLPEPVQNLLDLQRARIELGRAGARTVELRGGRLSATPLEMDAAAVGRLRERIPEAIYESRTKTLSLRVPEDPAERLTAVLGLADTLRAAMVEPVAA
jgi:transcription-repair coupling factor (superfamily II helicase)